MSVRILAYTVIRPIVLIIAAYNARQTVSLYCQSSYSAYNVRHNVSRLYTVFQSYKLSHNA